MTQLTRPAGTPANWSTPGLMPPPGLPRRLSTVDPGAPDQVAARQLFEAAEAMQCTRVSTGTRYCLQIALPAFDAALKLPQTEQRGRQRNKAQANARVHIDALPAYASDEQVFMTARIGLRRMATAATCLVDDFQAAAFESGMTLARFALVELIARLEVQEAIALHAEGG